MKTSYSVHELRHLRRMIGQNIHAARTRRQFTLSKLARTSGVPEWRIDQYELGKNEIGLDDMLRLASALGVNLPALITL